MFFLCPFFLFGMSADILGSVFEFSFVWFVWTTLINTSHSSLCLTPVVFRYTRFSLLFFGFVVLFVLLSLSLFNLFCLIILFGCFIVLLCFVLFTLPPSLPPSPSLSNKGEPRPFRKICQRSFRGWCSMDQGCH